MKPEVCAEILRNSGFKLGEKLMPSTIQITLDHAGKRRGLVVPINFLDFMLSAHAQALTTWANREVAEYVECIFTTTSNREQTIAKAEWMHDELDKIADKRAIANSLEEIYRDLLM